MQTPFAHGIETPAYSRVQVIHLVGAATSEAALPCRHDAGSKEHNSTRCRQACPDLGFIRPSRILRWMRGIRTQRSYANLVQKKENGFKPGLAHGAQQRAIKPMAAAAVRHFLEAGSPRLNPVSVCKRSLPHSLPSMVTMKESRFLTTWWA